MEMKDVLKQVALQNGFSEEEVREEMQKAIHDAYLQKSPAFVAAFTSRRRLTSEEVKELRELVDRYEEEE